MSSGAAEGEVDTCQVVPAEGEVDTCQVEQQRVRWTHVKWRTFCSQMSLVFSCHVLIDAHMSTDIEGNASSQRIWWWQCHGVGRNPS